MAATLQGLPTELLLQIIETQSNNGFPDWEPPEVALPSKRQRFSATLRAMCAELNAKLPYFFATKYPAKIRMSLDEANISRLQAMPENSVHPHVRSIVVDVGSLFHRTFFDDAWGSSDDSEYPWSSSTASDVLDAQCYKYGMDEDVATFIADGSCSQVLRTALLRFRNLKSIQIVPPSVCGTMAERKWLAIESRWGMASRVLLNVVFTSVPLLEEFLVIGGVNSHPMPLPLSSLDLVATYSPGWLSSLQKLHLWLERGMIYTKLHSR